MGTHQANPGSGSALLPWGEGGRPLSSAWRDACSDLKLPFRQSSPWPQRVVVPVAREGRPPTPRVCQPRARSWRNTRHRCPQGPAEGPGA